MRVKTLRDDYTEGFDELPEAATPQDVADAKAEAVAEAKAYTDQKVSADDATQDARDDAQDQALIAALLAQDQRDDAQEAALQAALAAQAARDAAQDASDEAWRVAQSAKEALQDARDDAQDVRDTGQDATLTSLDSRLDAEEAEQPGGGGAQVGLPYTVISAATDSAVRAGIIAWANNRTSAGNPRTKLAWSFVGKANLNPANGDLFTGVNPGSIRGGQWVTMGKDNVQLGWPSATVPLLNTRGQLRNFRSEGLTICGDVAGAKGVLSYNSEAAGCDQDWTLSDWEWTGTFDYGLAFDGPADYNLGSEITLHKPACRNSTTFTRGLLAIGLSGSFPQLDQALNYSIYAPKFEGAGGPYVAAYRGGSIGIEGRGSWMHTQPNGGPMIYMPKVASHFYSVQYLHMIGQRIELRYNTSKWLDCGWLSAGRVVVDNLSTESYAASIAPFEEATLRGGATLITRGCGHIGYVGLQESGGVVRSEYPYLPGSTGMTKTLTDFAGTGLVRKASATTGSATFL